MKFLLLILSFPLIVFSQETLLTGRVWDPKDASPVQNAEVRIFFGTVASEQITTTDETGRFVFTSEQASSKPDCAIIINKDDYHRLNGTVRLNYGVGQDRKFNLYQKQKPKAPIVKLEEVYPGPSLLGAPSNNLIFLIDISGSMAEQNRLGNLKESLSYLVSLYRPEDQISIITYSSSTDILLKGARISELSNIEAIINGLKPTGLTKGVAGLLRAYELANQYFISNGNNKVVLATDGIFGEDKKSRKLVENAIIQGRGQNVRLSIFSFGEEVTGISERLDYWSSIGKGHHTHIDTVDEAKEQIVLEARGQRPIRISSAGAIRFKP